MDPQHQIGWITYLFGDPYLPGVVTWVGTAATLIGFVIAIRQLQKATAASVAAQSAAQKAARDIGSHEFSSKLTTALEHFNSAQDHLQRQNPDAAAAYLQVAWAALVDAQNLAVQSEDVEQLIDFAQRSRQAIDLIRSPINNGVPVAILAAQMYPEVGTMIAAVGVMAARVRMRVSGLGTKQ